LAATRPGLLEQVWAALARVPGQSHLSHRELANLYKILQLLLEK
jgi:hypothetical protein